MRRRNAHAAPQRNALRAHGYDDVPRAVLPYRDRFVR